MLDKSEQNCHDHFAFQNNKSFLKAAVVNEGSACSVNSENHTLKANLSVYCFVLFFVVVFSDSDGSKRTANEDREESDYNAEGIFALETYRYSNR